MALDDFLARKAVEDIWDNPHIDNQVIFRANRLTKEEGFIGKCFRVPFNQYEMPTVDKAYHLIELGYNNQNRLGILNDIYGWTTLTTLSEDEQLIIQVFNQGRMLVTHGGYFRVLSNKNILIALPVADNTLIFMPNEDTYVRFYSNIGYDQGGFTTGPTTGILVNSSADLSPLLSWMNEVDVLAISQRTPPLVYVDGLLLPMGITTHNTIPDGATLTYLADPSIARIDSLPLSSLNSYLSAIDNVTKLHFSLDDNDIYRYVDDIDVYVTAVRSGDQRRIGLYYPRLDPSFLRALTNNDWGIRSSTLLKRFDDLSDLFPNEDLSDREVLFVQRDTRHTRPTVTDSHRINLLETLPAIEREGILTGVNAVIDLWRASNLEKAPINIWRGLTYKELNIDKLKGVFSVRAVIYLIEHVYQEFDSTEWSIPPMASNGGGDLLYFKPTGLERVTYDTLNHGNEVYSDGTGNELFLPGHNALVPLDTVSLSADINPTVVDYGFGVKAYYLNNDTLVDAVLNRDYSLHRKNDVNITEVHWGADLIKYDRYVRTAQRRIEFVRTITVSDIRAGISLYDGVNYQHDVGFNQTHVLLQGRYLSYGLDYTIKAGLIYIVSLSVTLTSPVELTVVCTGLPHSSLQFEANVSTGWVVENHIENKDRFKLSDNTNVLLFINGIPYNKTGVTMGLIDNLTVPDGSPYVIVPISEYSDLTELSSFLYTLEEDVGIDTKVNAYLNTVVPAYTFPISVAQTQYVLVSPLMDALLLALHNDTLIIPPGEISYTLKSFLLSPFIHLTVVDPSQRGLSSDRVIIIPSWTTTPVDVTQDELNFLTFVNDHFLEGLVTGLDSTTYINLI